MVGAPFFKRTWVRRTLRWSAIALGVIALAYASVVLLLIISFASSDWSF